MRRLKMPFPIRAFLAGASLVLAFLTFLSAVGARDFGQWENTDPAIKHWYQSLMQPDNPDVSCCGEADAYWADSFEMSPNGEYVAIITDERELPYRHNVPVGTRIVVPNYKIKWDRGNPTGHGVIFLAPHYTDTDPYHVYCYLPPVSG
jgi:hypothetical protein